jgi:ABC-2 type transport system permease protein
MVADSDAGLAWIRWASPLGWVENLRPLTGSQPLALLPIIGFTAAATGAAIAVAGRRDLGAGVLVRRGVVKPNTRLLGGAGGLAVRLERWVALAWALGLGLLALIFGVTAVSVTKADGGVDSVEQAVGRIGGQASGATAWIGYEFLYIAALVAFAAVGQMSATRGEEADGHLDNLLARRVSRARWLAGRLAFGTLFVAVTGLATGVGGWLGIATGSSDIGFATMVQAGLNVVAPALFVLGLGTLLYGLVPRLTLPILYGVVLWSLLIEIIGTTITTNHWLLDTALVSHIGPVPATALNWTAMAWLTGLGVLAALAGLGAFERRDLVAA